MRFIKEMYDIDVIDTGVKSILDHGKDGLLPHFIYSGEYYYGTKRLEFREMLLTKMKSYRIQSAVLTKLTMWRRNLVTKETVKKAYKGAMKTEKVWNRYEGSINDDLETFFINLQDQETIKEDEINSFFTPKLIEEELKLVEERNEEHLRSYSFHSVRQINPDVDVDEMKRSNSSSKFVHVFCFRKTEPLKVALKRKNVDN